MILLGIVSATYLAYGFYICSKAACNVADEEDLDSAVVNPNAYASMHSYTYSMRALEEGVLPISSTTLSTFPHSETETETETETERQTDTESSSDDESGMVNTAQSEIHVTPSPICLKVQNDNEVLTPDNKESLPQQTLPTFPALSIVQPVPIESRNEVQSQSNDSYVNFIVDNYNKFFANVKKDL